MIEVEAVYLHKKSGVKYRVLSLAYMENDDSSVVVYQSLLFGGKIWVRPMMEFDDKFERVSG